MSVNGNRSYLDLEFRVSAPCSEEFGTEFTLQWLWYQKGLMVQTPNDILSAKDVPTGVRAVYARGVFDGTDLLR